MSETYIARKKTLLDIQQIALRFRRDAGITGCFDPLRYIEHTLCIESPSITFLIIGDDDDERFLIEDAEASTVVYGNDLKEEKEIYICIPESIYLNATSVKRLRARFTITHELAHVLLHSDKQTTLYRDKMGDVDPIYNKYVDPEWQADELAAEILAPVNECIGLSTLEIMQKFEISKEAARIRFDRAKRLSLQNN